MGRKPKQSKPYHADGELIEDRPVRKILENANLSVDEILGRRELSDYDQTTESSYAEYIGGLADLELQKECITRGLFPKDNRRLNIERLVEVYHQKNVKAAIINEKPIVLSQKLTKEQKEILAGGANKLT